MAVQNPNSWTQEQPRPPQGRLLTSTSTPPAPFMTSTPTATNLATTRNMEEEPSVQRNEMNKFAGLKACLRKPCPWKEQCRNLHVPYGEKGNTWNVIKKCKFSPFRRTYEMSREPAPVPASRTKARPEGQIKPTQKGHHQGEGRGSSPRRSRRSRSRSRTRSSSEDMRVATKLVEKMMKKRRR